MSQNKRFERLGKNFFFEIWLCNAVFFCDDRLGKNFFASKEAK